MKIEVRMKILHGSADAQYVLVDGDSDNEDVLAIIDPNEILEGLGIAPRAFAEEMARSASANVNAIRLNIGALIDENDVVENSAPYGSPKYRAALRRGNALRAALKVLSEVE